MFVVEHTTYKLILYCKIPYKPYNNNCTKHKEYKRRIGICGFDYICTYGKCELLFSTYYCMQTMIDEIYLDL